MNKKASAVWQELLTLQSDVFGYLKQAVGDAEIAKDLFQEVYLRAVQHINDLDAQRSLKAWLLTVARNLVINFYRDSGRKTFVAFDEEKTGHDSAKWSLADEAIERALTGLPERQRKVLLRRELDGLSYDALCKEFDLSLPALSSLLNRARENLKRQYQLYFLPQWVRQNAGHLPVDDLLRLISPVPVPGDVMHLAQEKSQRFFSAVRHRWDALRKRFFPEERLKEIFEVLGSFNDKIVLDAGSGTGMVAISAALRAGRVLALDMNPQMINDLAKLRRQLALDNLHIVRGDLRRLCIGNERVDLVFATLVLHHLPRPERWFAETVRILRPSGRFIVVEFDRHGNKQLADTMHDLWLGFPPHLLRRWAKANGLKERQGQNWTSSEGVPVYYRIYEKP